MVSEQSSKMEARLDDMETRMSRIEKEVKRISAIEDSMKELRSEMKLMFRGLAQMIEELLQQSSLQHIPTTMMNTISSLKEFVAPNFHPSSAKQMETTRSYLHKDQGYSPDPTSSCWKDCSQDFNMAKSGDQTIATALP
ncbi:hypothetical protein Scep_023716 [Stephania cephalantha]|uniref:Uncharacterized protein n=1 Tax=Stephania cephalantha TaxID=152367 RepID=A0AAP0EW76_9MAGN